MNILAQRCANYKLLLHNEDYVNTLGALTGNQAMQQVRAGLKAIYPLDGKLLQIIVAGGMYPDQSIYPANSGPELVKINRTLSRADEIEVMESGSHKEIGLLQL